ncbi:MAG: hypothetical protein ACF8Q5_10960 [Phycisphaerales bacterium JB040]
MPRSVHRLRRVALLLIGLSCVLAGLALVYVLVRPGVLRSASTLQLALVAGLLVWPGVTLALLQLDNACGRGRSGGRGSAGPA